MQHNSGTVSIDNGHDNVAVSTSHSAAEAAEASPYYSALDEQHPSQTVNETELPPNYSAPPPSYDEVIAADQV